VAKYSPDQPRDDHGRFGSGGQPEAARPAWEEKALADRKAEDMRRYGLAVKDLATEFNYPPELVSVSDQPKTFTLNGKQYDYAGAAAQDGKITIWPDQVIPSELREVMAHEVMHERFNYFLDQYETEQSAATAASSAADWEKPASPLDPQGRVRPEWVDKYPLVAAVSANDLMDPFKMSETDGVSDYSKSWWKAWGDATANSKSAFHETLAEIAANEVKASGGRKQDPFLTVESKQWPKTGADNWARLYTLINSTWDKGHPKAATK